MPAFDITAFIAQIKTGTLDAAKAVYATDKDAININATREGSKSLLHLAIENGSVAKVKWLVEELGANLNPRDEDGNTPLHYAVIYRNKDITQYLLEQGANYTATNYDKETLSVSTYQYVNDVLIQSTPQSCQSDGRNPGNIQKIIGFFDGIEVHKGKSTLSPATNMATSSAVEAISQDSQRFEHYKKLGLTGNPNNGFAHPGDERVYPIAIEQKSTPTVVKSNKATAELSRGLTPLQLAQRDGKWEIAELISDYIFNAQHNILKRIESNQKQLANKTIQTLQPIKPPLKTSILSIPSIQTCATLISATFFVGLMLSADGDNVFVDKSRLLGKALVSFCSVALVTYITHQMVKTSQEIKNLMSNARSRAGLLADAFQETIVANAQLLRELQKATKTVNDVITDLGQKTGTAIVQLQDELTGSLVQLRGDATKISQAIQNGIRDGRFTPTAVVNAAFNIDVDVDIDNRKNGINFLTL